MNFNKTCKTILLGAFILFTSPSLLAQTLYGASTGLESGFGLSDLYTVDPATGTATPIGPIGFQNVTGMAFLPDGRLVASARGDDLVQDGGQAAVLIPQSPGRNP